MRISIMELNMVLLLFCVVGLSHAMIIPQLDPYWDNIDNYCGSRLANELRFICKGKYNDEPASQQQLSIEQKRRLGVPLVADECCTLPCTRKTLKMYCAPGPQ